MQTVSSIAAKTILRLWKKHFIIWLAQKRFLVASSLVEERKCVAEIADLLRYIKDQLVFDQCIDQLAKLHGKVKTVARCRRSGSWGSPTKMTCRPP